MTLQITPFDSKYKQLLKSIVVKIGHESLPGLYQNFSAEGGFELPLTDYWKSNTSLKNYEFLKYHNARQLRFVSKSSDEYISELRVKDGINYWTNNELEALGDIIERVSSKIHLIPENEIPIVKMFPEKYF